MANVCMKFEKAGPNQTLVIDRTRLYKTDGRSDGQTGAKSSSSTGGGWGGGGAIIIIIMILRHRHRREPTYSFSRNIRNLTMLSSDEFKLQSRVPSIDVCWSETVSVALPV